jgi:small conductance mechanosensitive channel
MLHGALLDLFTAERLVAWGGAFARALAIVIAGVILARLVAVVAGRAAAARSRLAPERTARARTLETLLLSTIRYSLDFFVALAVLQVLGVNVASLLAAAGIVGLAVGFGAQSLVRDIIGGFFIVFEDQFAVGDYITAGTTSGVVEDISLRSTRLRDFNGDLHILPNGRIDAVTNHSRGPARVMFTVEVAREEDLARVTAVLDDVCRAAAADLDAVTEGPRVLGVDRLTPSGVGLLVWALTRPLEHWGVERELLRRVKDALDAAGIKTPPPCQLRG